MSLSVLMLVSVLVFTVLAIPPAFSRTSCCPLPLGYSNSNIVEPTPPFLQFIEDNNIQLNMAKAGGESQVLPGSDRGVGSLSGPATGIPVSPDDFQPGAPPNLHEYQDLWRILEMRLGSKHGDRRGMAREPYDVTRRFPEVPRSSPIAPSRLHPAMVARSRGQRR